VRPCALSCRQRDADAQRAVADLQQRHGIHIPIPPGKSFFSIGTFRALLKRKKEGRNMKTKSTTNKNGFSLIELLIVITIMALLIGLLVPALMTAKEKANRLHCANNLSQFGKALVMYGSDHDETFPSNLVFLAIANYASEPALFKCKSDRTRKATELVSDITAPAADTYCSYNLVLKDQDGNPLGSSIAPTMLIACDKDGSKNNVTSGSFGGNHNKEGGNILRGDSSVRWIDSTRWSSNTWNSADLTSVAGF
jgi:prepilin-type N-terminal cleavage/methylation domain-containing protein